MNLRRLRYFVAVGEDLHFTKAAARLNVAQPALSQAIQRLEAELGVKLLHRTRRDVRLTLAGAVLLADGRKLLTDAELATRRTRAAEGGTIGLLRLAFVDAAGYDLMPRLLKAFHAEMPGVSVTLHAMDGETMARTLEVGDVDVGILHAPASRSLEYKALERDELVFAIPPTHPLSRREVIDLSTLHAADVIMPERDEAPEAHDVILDHYRRSSIDVKVVASTATIQTMLSLVACDLGLAIVPKRAQRWARDRVVFRPLVPQLDPLEFGVAWAPQHVNAVTRAFVETAERVVTPALAPLAAVAK